MYEDSKHDDLPNYLSYMVRLWRIDSRGEWLASLEAPGTHERHSFTDLASFFEYLLDRTGNASKNETPRHDNNWS